MEYIYIIYPFSVKCRRVPFEFGHIWTTMKLRELWSHVVTTTGHGFGFLPQSDSTGGSPDLLANHKRNRCTCLRVRR